MQQHQVCKFNEGNVARHFQPVSSINPVLHKTYSIVKVSPSGHQFSQFKSEVSKDQGWGFLGFHPRGTMSLSKCYFLIGSILAAFLYVTSQSTEFS
jgi:hypothetical protein